MKLNQLLSLAPDKECETVATGFQQLDHLTGGLRTGQLCTIAARPGMGKTAFAVSLLRNIGEVQKVPMNKVRVWNRKPCKKRRSCFHGNSLVWQFFAMIWSKRCS